MQRTVSRVRNAAVVLSAAAVLAACGSADSPNAAPSSGTPATGSGAPAASGSGTPVASDSSAPAATGASAGSATAASPAPTSAAGTPGTIEVVVTEAEGCTVTPDTAPAGAITFHVVNQDAVGVTEVELVSGHRIRGERENLAPGFDDSFSVKLDGGSYEVFCPGAAKARTPFTVTGQAAATTGDVAELLQQATVDYADYVDLQAGFLVDEVAPLVAAIKSGDLKAAQLAYAKARPYYERIEPVAESFGDLDPAIDARAGDVPAAEWTGFHPIEQGLFEKKSTKGLEKLADKLQADVKDLQARATELGTNTRDKTDGDRYQPDEVANGAVALLGEVQASKITGEEERYSRIDILDFHANVEGSLQAFAALQPALNSIDKTVVPGISAKFDELSALLETYRDPAAIGGFTLYNDLKPADTKKLTDALLAVIEPLSKVSAKIATA